MATTDISTEIVSITGVAAHGASDEFIVSAQKFVVASVPKELLPFAVNRSSSSNDGSAIPIENDSIIDVQRNEYSCKQISLSESKWANDTTSLKKSTAISPVYWVKNDGVQIAPDTDGSNLGYVFYVNYAEVDDDSDLRDAVVYRACSSEFSKLSIAELPTVSISATLPVIPSLTSVTFTSVDSDIDASSPLFIAAAVSAGGVYGANTAPTYTKPVRTPQTSFNSYWTLGDFGDADPTALSISAVPPDVPSLATVSFSESNALSISATAPTAISLTSVSYTSVDSDVDASAPTVTTATVSAGGVYGANTAPAYTKSGHPAQVDFNSYWTLGDFGDSDPGPFGLVASPPSSPSAPSFSTPDISSVSISNVGVSPSYTSPTVTGGAGLTGMESGTIDDDTDQIEFDTWWDTLGEMIESEEDTELASAQVQKINSYISAYSQEMQDSLNVFNKENAVYQGKLQESIHQAQINAQEAQQEANLILQEENQQYAATLQKYQADVGKYQSEVGKEVQEYTQKLSRYQLELGTVYQAWAKTESDNIQVFQADIQNELNEFNKENVPFQANIQEAMQEIQVANQVNLAQGQADLQVAVDNEQRSQERQLQTAVNDMQAIVADNQRKITQYQAEASHYSTEVNQYIQNYTSRLQKDVQDTQATIANNGDLLQKYQSELGQYQAEVSAEVQEHSANMSRYQLELNTVYTAWAKTESDNVAAYQSDIQNELNEFNKENIAYQANIQEAMQELQVSNQVNIASAQASLQVAIDNENRSQQRQIQNGINDMQAIVSNNGNLISKHQSELQQYSSEVQTELSEYQSKISKQQAYSKESDKYYQWSVNCINMYIQNNSKMIAATMASRSQAAQS